MARINKKVIVEELALQDFFAEAPKYKIEQFVEDFFQSLADKVIAGDEVAIPGFGKFAKFTTSTTGKHKPKFTPYGEFKAAMNPEAA